MDTLNFNVINCNGGKLGIIYTYVLNKNWKYISNKLEQKKNSEIKTKLRRTINFTIKIINHHNQQK